MILTFKLRLKDKHSSELIRQARAVNTVWNFCNETQRKAASEGRKWLSNYDLQKLTAGSSVMLGIQSQTICKVCEHYYRSRKAKRRPSIKFRGRRSLGWVPFHGATIKFDGEAFVFRGLRYVPMHLRSELSAGIKISDGSFNQDARGRWYINVPIDIEDRTEALGRAVGIDLGLKDLATTSDGQSIKAPSFYRKSEALLASVAKARKTKRLRNIHARVANRRKDFLHKASTKIVSDYGLIIVGDVSSSKLAKTSMAKSVHDAGWASFKTMLSYKSLMNGGSFIEVDEAYTSQTCSMCGSLPPSRPRGIAGLGIREWSCDDCGSVHDRDVNAARNILRIGLDSLGEGAAPMRSRHALPLSAFKVEDTHAL